MKIIKVPTQDQLSDESQAILAQVKQRLGKIPNLYATIGYSPTALKGMLEFEATLGQHPAFDPKEKEAINLIVSQRNHCDYCLAAHTMLAKMRGFSEEETIAIRKGELADTKLNNVIRLAGSMVENKGPADQQILNEFFNVGYNEAALIELIGLVTVRTFTNYVYANTNIPIDFPAAAELN